MLRKRFSVVSLLTSLSTKPGSRFIRTISSSLLLRIRFARFTNVFSLAVKYLISLLGSIILATLVGLGTSSFG